MTRSTITAKNQTTVPREVRQRLGVGPSDVLLWDVVGDAVRVTVSQPAFLRRRGSIHVGPGSVIEDVQRARELRGKERW